MTRHRTTFSHAVRVLACPECAAPIEAGLEGGTAVCTYCRATLVVARRDERDDRARAEAAPKLSESERHARLWDQAGRRWFPSPSVRAFVENGTIPRHRVEDAVARWQQLRARLMEGEEASFTLQEELLHLTLLLEPHLRENNLRARGVLEGALELLDDPIHRQLLRAQLIEEAIRDGDLAGAESWLDGLDPRSSDIHADGAFRIATALLAAANGNAKAIRVVLGDGPSSVPLAHDHYVPAAVLRAHAYELDGYVDVASSQLCMVMAGSIPSERATASRLLMATPRGFVPISAVIPCQPAVERYLAEAGVSFPLCATAYPAARAELSRRYAPRPPEPAGVLPSGVPTGHLANQTNIDWRNVPLLEPPPELDREMRTILMRLVVLFLLGLVLLVVLLKADCLPTQ